MKTTHHKNQSLILKIVSAFAIFIVFAVNGKGQVFVDGFDYPIGNRGYDVDSFTIELQEFFANENNNLYPMSKLPASERARWGGTSSTEWYNYQDVGNYYSVFNGYHSGEDWNKSNDEIGASVFAVAYGKVIDIRKVYSSDAKKAGWQVVIEHYLTDIDTVYSIYLHIASPDAIDGNTSTSFPYSEGSYVTRGQKIGVIADITEFNEHLHFQMIYGTIDVDNLYSGTNSGYFQSYLDMQNKGIIDPSDFIDANRPGIINHGMNIYGGSINNAKNIVIKFRFSHSNFTISNFKIGNNTIPQEYISSVAEIIDTTCFYSFIVSIPNNLPGCSDGNSYNLSFNLTSNTSGSIYNYKGRNQLYFLNSGNFIKPPPAINGDYVSSDDWFANFVAEGIELGLYKGDGIDKFFPNMNMSRAEMAKIVVTAAINLGLMRINTNTINHRFTDVPISSWYFPYVQTLANYGYINTDNENFNPNNAIKTGEFAKILVNSFQFTYADVNINDINSGQGIKNSTLIIDAADSNIQEYLEIISNILNVRMDYNNIMFLEPLACGLEDVLANEIQDGQKIATGENIVTRAIMAKILANAYKYRVYNPIASQAPPTTKSLKATEDFSNWTVIGDKFELTSSTSGVVPVDMHRSKTLTTNEVWDLGELLVEIGGFPATYFWSVNGGTLEEVNPNNIHNHVKFTAPNTATNLDLYLCILVGNGKNYVYTWDITVEEETVDAPTVQASNLQVVKTTFNSVEISWTRGNGSRCVVTCNENNQASAIPVNGELYNYSTDFLSAPIISGSNTKIIYVGESENLTISNLEDGKTYSFKVYEYNMNNENTLSAYLYDNVPWVNGLTPAILPIELDFSWTPNTIIENTNVNFTALGNNFDNVAWSFEGSMTGSYTNTTQQILFLSSGTKAVQLTATNSTTGQSVTITKNVEVLSTASALPDLVTQDAFVTPNPVMLGTDLTVRCNFQNQGLLSTNPCYARFFLSDDAIYDTGDEEINNLKISDALESGGISTLEFSRQISSGVYSTGTKYLIIYADFVQQIPELDESNNISVIPFEIVDFLPDFYFNSFSVTPSTFQGGQYIDANFDIAGSAGSNIIKFYISKTTSIEDADYINMTSISTPINSTYSFLTVKNSFPDGQYYIIAKIDANNDFVETNEDNNIAYYPITISSPNQPTVQTSNIYVSDVTGSSLRVNWTNGNGENRFVMGHENSGCNVPDDGEVHATNTNYSLATDFSFGTKALYYGNVNFIDINGLTTDKTYYFSTLEYNNSGVDIDYLQAYQEGVFTMATNNYSISNGWQTLITSGFDFHIIKFFNENTGFAFDKDGSIARTEDGGKSWVYKSCPDGNSAYFLNSIIAWVVGKDGEIHKTMDGGNTWITQNSGTKREIINVEFIDVNIGYIVCKAEYGLVGDTWTSLDNTGAVFKTVDGGNTWVEVLITDDDMEFISFVSTSTGWVAGDKYAMKTTNGGQTWEKQSFSLYGIIGSMYFIDTNIGFINDFGHILKTADGGNTWSEKGRTTPSTMSAIHFYDENFGIVVSDKDISITRDGGNVWSLFTYEDRLFDVQCINENIIYAGGYDFIKTETGGQTQFINAPIISNTTACLPEIIELTYTIDGVFNTGNIFKVQLSDENGSFNYPIIVGESETVVNGMIKCELPNGIVSGSNYKTRLVSSNPSIVGAASNSFIISEKPNVSISGIESSYYTTDASFIPEATPVGGSFTLDGNIITEIAPNTLLPGEHGLVYTYSNGTCENEVSKTVTILAPNNITTQNLPNTSYCAYSQLNVDYSIEGNYNEDNQFIAELSDENGNFTNSIDIGSISSVSNGSIACILPYNLATGSGYMARVRSTSPAIIGNETTAFTINAASNTAVDIVADETSVCQDSAITFTANYESDGTPIFNWRINGNTVSNDIGSFTYSNLNNGDVVSLQIVSNGACPFPATANSNSINISIKNMLTPYVDILSTKDNICALERLEFTASPVNEGSNPIYQWTVNDVNVDENSINMTIDTLTINSTIKLTMTSSEECTTTSIVSANRQITVDKVPTQAEMPTGETVLYQNPENKAYSVSELQNATAYEWVLTPSNAGVLSTSGKNSIIDYDDSYLGAIFLKVRGVNGICLGDYSDDLSINIYKKPSYTVTFTITDGTNPIGNTNVMLTGYGTLTANASGIATFYNVNPESNIAYTVTASTYDDVTGAISVVDKDVAENVSLTTTGIDDVLVSVFSIYPNPTSDVVVIKYEGKLKNAILKIIDGSGHVIYKKEPLDKDKLSYSFGEKKGGIYLITLEGKGFKKTLRIILSK